MMTKVTPQMVNTVIERCATAVDCHEKKLWLAVIKTAVKDSITKLHKNECERFFLGRHFETICDYVGLDAQATRELIGKLA